MKRIFLKISDTRLECQDEHPSCWRRWSRIISTSNISAAKATAAPAARVWSPAVDWLTEPLAFIQPGEILPCCCRAKGDIEIEM